MKRQPKPKRSSIALQKELLEYRPASDLTLRDLYQERADLEKERLVIFESAQHDARDLKQNEKDREIEILQSLLKLAIAETHLRRNQDRRRASASVPIEEPAPDTEHAIEQFKLGLEPTSDAVRTATPGYDERFKAMLTAKIKRMRWLTQETATIKEKVRGVLHNIAPAIADVDLLDSAEVIAGALVTARISDSWTPSRLLKKFQRHVSAAKRSLTDTEKWLRRIDIDLREMTASDRPGDLQTSVNGQLLDADWEPGPLITSNVDNYLGLSISSALEAIRSTNLILKIPGISAPKGAPRNHGRFALYLVTAHVFHKLTGQKPTSIGTDDGHPSGRQWNLCEEIWRIGWPKEANLKGAKPPEDTIRKAFRTFRDEHLRKRNSCDVCKLLAT
jgi:hypothetical protein